MEYYSQHRQDRYLDEEIFKSKENGVFVDVGAFNGEAFSNTCFFERFRDWTGLCIEPLPEYFEQMKTKRKCQLLNACVSDTEGEQEFWHLTDWCSMLSGLASSYDEAHVKRIHSELKDYGGTKSVTKVKTYLLKNILAQYNLTHIDYISIDTEGSEMQILKSIDFSKVNITCFSVEDNYNDPAFDDFLKQYGYSKINRLGTDNIYLR